MCSTLLLLQALQKWQLGLWSFCILLFIIFPNCASTQLFLVPYSFFVFCCWRRPLPRCKHCNKGSQVPTCLTFSSGGLSVEGSTFPHMWLLTAFSSLQLQGRELQFFAWCWPETTITSLRSPAISCHMRFPNMTFFFLTAREGKRDSKKKDAIILCNIIM